MAYSFDDPEYDENGNLITYPWDDPNYGLSTDITTNTDPFGTTTGIGNGITNYLTDDQLIAAGMLPSNPTDAQINSALQDALSDGSLIQKGSQLLDKTGKVIGDLSKSGALSSIASYLLNNQQTKLNQELQNSLQQSAVGNLTDFSNKIGNTKLNDLTNYYNNVQTNVPAAQVLTPLQTVLANASQQGDTALKNIAADPNDKAAVQSSLAQLDAISKQGYGPVEQAAVARILGQIQQQNTGQQAAIKSDLASRGQYGSGQELVSRQLASQANANANYQNGLDVAAAAAQRALDAIQQKGTLGLSADQQDFNQQATKASAQDVINQFNTNLQQQINSANAAAQNTTNQSNQTAAYGVQNTNIGQANQSVQNAAALAKAKADAEAQNQQNLIAQENQERAALSQAGSNASNMWQAPYKAAQAGTAAGNQAITNALQPSTGTSNTSTGSSANTGSGLQNIAKDVGAVGTIVNAGKSLWDFFSDETVKKDKKDLTDDDIMSILDGLAPKSFQYKGKATSMGAPKGRVVGVMAQDIIKTPAAGIVKEENGIKKVDGEKALSLALAALTSMNSRLKDLEGK